MSNFIKNANWRYATKKYDNTKKVSKEDLEQLKEAIEGSTERPIVLFKHSTRCSISSMSKTRFCAMITLCCNTYTFPSKILPVPMLSSKIAV